MSEVAPATSSQSDAYQLAGKALGIASLVTQWDQKGKVKRQVSCLRVGQLAFNETMFFILERDRVQGFAYLADITGMQIEPANHSNTRLLDCWSASRA